jgi:hypothetical protein
LEAGSKLVRSEIDVRSNRTSFPSALNGADAIVDDADVSA